MRFRFEDRTIVHGMKPMKLNPATTVAISDELYEASIGWLNSDARMHGTHVGRCIIHLIDSVTRGYTTPLEAYESIQAVRETGYFPEHLKTRPSAYVDTLYSGRSIYCVTDKPRGKSR